MTREVAFARLSAEAASWSTSGFWFFTFSCMSIHFFGQNWFATLLGIVSMLCITLAMFGVYASEHVSNFEKWNVIAKAKAIVKAVCLICLNWTLWFLATIIPLTILLIRR